MAFDVLVSGLRSSALLCACRIARRLADFPWSAESGWILNESIVDKWLGCLHALSVVGRRLADVWLLSVYCSCTAEDRKLHVFKHRSRCRFFKQGHALRNYEESIRRVSRKIMERAAYEFQLHIQVASNDVAYRKRSHRFARALPSAPSPWPRASRVAHAEPIRHSIDRNKKRLLPTRYR